jgi:ferritin
MVKPSVLAALNKQVQHEINNSHAYRAVALYFTGLNLHGLAKWMNKQVDDEMGHAKRFIDHAVDRNARVELGAIAAPKPTFASPLEAAKDVLAMERKTTDMIHALYALAGREEDYAAQSMLKWFIDEQVEEEKWSTELVEMLESIGSSVGSLYMLDHRWEKRAEEAK